MFPSNIVSAASNNGQLLGVITFSILFGLFIGKLKPELREAQQKFWGSTQQVMLMLTTFIIRFAPIGVFGLVTPKLLAAPIDKLFGAILAFFLTVILALLIHCAINLAIMLKVFGKVNPLTHYKAMSPVLLTAFSTSSSSATLPLTMDTVEERSGISNKTCSFTLPLGATVNGWHRSLRMRRRALHRSALCLSRRSALRHHTADARRFSRTDYKYRRCRNPCS